MVINEKGVGKNVSAGTSTGARAEVTPRGRFETGSFVGSFSGLASTVLCAIAFAIAPTISQARPVSGLGEPVALSSLPREAQQAEQRIRAGGPFPYSQDGVVFGNRERHLDRQPRGYYHEYTVPSPGARDRGARRIVCGGTRLTEPDACFFTEDHYNSFHRIVK